MKSKIQQTTGLCMELTEEIIGMKYGESPDYDYLLSLVRDIQANQMKILREMYANDYDRVEIPDFIKAS